MYIIFFVNIYWLFVAYTFITNKSTNSVYLCVINPHLSRRELYRVHSGTRIQRFLLLLLKLMLSTTEDCVGKSTLLPLVPNLNETIRPRNKTCFIFSRLIFWCWYFYFVTVRIIIFLTTNRGGQNWQIKYI